MDPVFLGPYSVYKPCRIPPVGPKYAVRVNLHFAITKPSGPKISTLVMNLGPFPQQCLRVSYVVSAAEKKLARFWGGASHKRPLLQ
jgi:hypothetical protein